MKHEKWVQRKAEAERYLRWATEAKSNQTVIVSADTTVRDATVTGIGCRGFWTYGTWNGTNVRMYEGWASWEVVR